MSIPEKIKANRQDEPTVYLTATNVPATLKEDFRKKCESEGVTMSETTTFLVRMYVAGLLVLKEETGP